jgi:hypothetical protein
MRKDMLQDKRSTWRAFSCITSPSLRAWVEILCLRRINSRCPSLTQPLRLELVPQTWLNLRPAPQRPQHHARHLQAHEPSGGQRRRAFKAASDEFEAQSKALQAAHDVEVRRLTTAIAANQDTLVCERLAFQRQVAEINSAHEATKRDRILPHEGAAFQQSAQSLRHAASFQAQQALSCPAPL